MDVFETVRCSLCNGVDGGMRGRTGASERGGDGGVACNAETSEFGSGGVDAVGEDIDVAEVAVSDSGEGGRKPFAPIWPCFLW